MLDEIEKIAVELLGLSMEEVRTIRETLVSEVTTDEARYAARTALKHAEGSTTPLNDAADRAQQTYAKVRAKAMKDLPKLLSLILAEGVARQQRDEAAVARDKHWEAEYERRAVGPHPETRDLFGRLFEHGVTPWHLKALRDEEVAIIADLIRWKANDAKFKNNDTPWRPVLQIFADRLILEAGYGIKVKRSTPGRAVRGKRYSSPKHYLFHEMVEPHWATPSAAVAAPDVGGSGPIDEFAGDEAPHASNEPLGIDQAPEAAEAATISVSSIGDKAGATAIADPVEPIRPATPAKVDDNGPDEFELPAHIDEAQAKILTTLGERWVGMDDDWEWDLRVAIGFREQTDEEAIASVAAAKPVEGGTPFRYFIDAARQSGIEDGKAAYRAATVSRFALEMATMDQWKDARRSHGLDW